MKSLEHILMEVLAGWNGEHVSEPVLAAVRELATDARFDDITLSLKAFVARFGRQSLVYSVNHLPGVLLHNYVYRSTEASAAIGDEYWLNNEAGAAIKAAAFKDGQLAMVVSKIIQDLDAMTVLALSDRSE